MQHEEPFWLVWNPARPTTRFRHATHDAAMREARRLAGKNPGQQFYVLQAISRSEHNTVLTHVLGHPCDDDRIPF